MSFIEDNQIKQDFKNAVIKFGGNESVLNNLDGFKKDLLNQQNEGKKRIYYQLMMVLELSNVTYFLSNNDSLSSIDINNCVVNAEKTCGLSRGTAQDLLSVIFYGFNYGDICAEIFRQQPAGALKISLKSFEQSKVPGHVYGLDSYNNDLYQLQRIIDTAVGKKDNISEKFSVNEKDETIIKEKSEMLGFLCNQGHPKALLIKGELYLYGIGTEKSLSSAYNYLKKAADNGSSTANTLLGDYYFEKNYYSKAYEHYSDIGAVANRPQQKERLAAIIDNKKYHLLWFVFNTLSFIVSIIYSVLLLSGTFCPSGCKHYVTGIILIIFSLALLALSFLSFIKEKYDARKIFLFANCIMICICSFFAIVF